MKDALKRTYQFSTPSIVPNICRSSPPLVSLTVCPSAYLRSTSWVLPADQSCSTMRPENALWIERPRRNIRISLYLRPERGLSTTSRATATTVRRSYSYTSRMLTFRIYPSSFLLILSSRLFRWLVGALGSIRRILDLRQKGRNNRSEINRRMQTDLLGIVSRFIEWFTSRR